MHELLIEDDVLRSLMHELLIEDDVLEKSQKAPQFNQWNNHKVNINMQST
jgi:hypothetical protein